MAEVLDHGTRPDRLVQMHPFFKKAVMNNDSPHDAPPLPPGLDDSVEENSSNPVEKPSHHELLVTNPYRAPSSAISISGDSGRECWNTIEEDNDRDYNNTRRKRRRISSEPEQQTLEQICTNTHQQTRHGQLEEAARSYAEDDTSSKEPQIETSIVPSQMKSEEENARLPLDRSAGSTLTGDPSHLSCVNDLGSNKPSEHELSTSAPLIIYTIPEYETQMPTPKKRNIGINDNGKLINSPKGSPRHSPRSKKSDNKGQSNGAVKAGRKSKKVEMKNGRFVSSLQITLPYATEECGKKIDDILSRPSNTPGNSVPQKQMSQSAPSDKKAMHPFFLGKLAVPTQKQTQVASETSSIAPTSDDEANRSPKAPNPWKGVIFSSRKPLQKISYRIFPIWPPSSIQDVQPNQEPRRPVTILPATPSSVVKCKHSACRIKPDEDILWNFARSLQGSTHQSSLVHLPKRRVMSGKELSRCLASEIYGQPGKSNLVMPSLTSLKSRIESTPSAFDQGKAAGPQMWPQEYAPTCWQEVLQPEAQALHEWLSNLEVHQVQTGKLQSKMRPPVAKKRRKKRPDELDDFIVDSDDENNHANSTGKNAILLTGPSGSGKTASVFAVAQQLGFEVFEIHPGMRRNAKDIQDKVGDMTQNHLVQQADLHSRRSSVSFNDMDVRSPTPEPVAANQPTVASFMRLVKTNRNPMLPEANDTKEVKMKSQRQSLILFEEVDILFEEDKGFWSGVQSLIRTSKRPVILTCNDLTPVPLDELDLFTVLTYDRPETNLAVNHLAYTAAAEGHLLGQEALRNLFLSKNRDLRASLTELNLWCQMTVGSQQGGLDWMLPHSERCRPNQDGSVTRIVSQDTFVSGLDLLPVEFDDQEDLFTFAQENLDLSPVDWARNDYSANDTGQGGLQVLDEADFLAEARSVMDLLDVDVAPATASTISKVSESTPVRSPRDDLVQLYIEKLSERCLSRITVADALEALMEESRIGLPVSPGRKAPSLDSTALPLVTEVAPYVRSIVAHDQKLEQIRNELGGNGGPQAKRQRRTRASRAALEGGSKESTRRDKWFPESLDFAAVLATGNDWPQSRSGEVFSAAATPTSSMATDADADSGDTPR
ncbi:uncharacterized protein Z518_05134 [Rhinocladiella mackenziei CBS 650.93]|uniref:ATPase AAA-type core domain-containing protein n=1 Tax=Rhinocladiella mackenziei CBS 650.93 TaxID=1442369 RepID=A0A0D2FPY8_9EURO|nr:uncharacterized protein Z518_05134 [Rhinocladiella mackenziei CBS 650.93]KIX04267.1 hypothetical protein Z518_05134 [Rhinocladiella mackenziei CBS 650.93]